MYYINNKEYQCPVSITLDLFNDRWKLDIIYHLLEGDKRFKELHGIINEITQKTLTVKLKELEEKNIIHREAFAEVPPRVVYSLTKVGKGLEPVLGEMYKWGISYSLAHGRVSDQDLCKSSVCSSK